MNKAKRLEVYDKCNGHCAYCGTKIEIKDMQVDHIKSATELRYYKEKLRDAKRATRPADKEKFMEAAQRWEQRIKKEFGSIDNIDKIDNLNPSCRQCNFYKSSFSLEEFRKQMLTLHLRLNYRSPLKLYLFEKYKVAENKPWEGIFYFEKVTVKLKNSQILMPFWADEFEFILEENKVEE